MFKRNFKRTLTKINQNKKEIEKNKKGFNEN